jgi:hypothetical protein
METHRFNGIHITLDKQGAREFTKVSYPIRYGNYTELKTDGYVYQYNLNGEIKHIRGSGPSWPHPSEWLKRTVANDWIYYSAGSYDDVYDLFGEYYIPCLSYPSNAFVGVKQFTERVIQEAISSLEKLPETLRPLKSEATSGHLGDFLENLIRYGPEELRKRAQKFHEILGGPLAVLPPDTRHVDYDVVPVVVADGCLYNCGFCRVKTGRHFTLRPENDILRQINGLKSFYGRDLCNYNSLFLGQHDALHAGAGLLALAAETAYEQFDFEHSNLKNPKLFFFGSVDSFLEAKESLFETLNNLPFDTCINLGFESIDCDTLALLKKPLETDAVRTAFVRMIDINKRYEHIEISANFVIGDRLPPNHLDGMLGLIRDGLDHFYSKGSVYLSPLAQGETKRDIVETFRKVKRLSRLPVFIYLIQRL